MKHIKIFESYGSSMEFAIPTDMPDFDPEKAKKAYSEYLKKIGGQSKEDGGLSFPLIKEVYGNDSYNTRFMIAQALHILGIDPWSYNSYFPNPSASDLSLGTFYIGEAWQNEIMKKIPRELLVAIRPWVEKILIYPEKYIGSNLQMVTKSPEVSREKSKMKNYIAKFIAIADLEQSTSPISWVIVYKTKPTPSGSPVIRSAVMPKR